MNFSLSLTLYLALGLALTLLRRSQGMAFGDALFCGLFWPLDLLRRGIELLVRSLVQENAEQIKFRHSGVGRNPDDLTTWTPAYAGVTNKPDLPQADAA